MKIFTTLLLLFMATVSYSQVNLPDSISKSTIPSIDLKILNKSNMFYSYTRHTIQMPKAYEIDFTTVKTTQYVIILLKAMNIIFYEVEGLKVDPIKKYLKLKK